ncbi:putative transcriptional regulator, MerR family protein [Streptomyces bingchenggensis BCW-1]|uniref:Putative transcriptional regulator, MerR family protein n=1 Tax=Streptomyces bingchenggensis (strain BCW-1) TaxID=749414 RepID=D7CHA9_STRBB|nr:MULTISPECIES: MerR family transcriptional regulator [Streptomyces]ADI06966.1 putative transcriptional regulator, MerR family protein [Streptomyces bingchenggensis BCW-1]
MLRRVNDDDPLSIGQFARLVRLSVKQLRHYADLGLLPPARVDPDTGYRYYRADQARDAMSIGLLRSLDVPLAAIKDVLSGQDPARALGDVRDRLDDELARRRRSLAALERILAGGLPTAEVTLRREEPQRVAVVRDVADSPEDIGRVTGACVGRLLALLAAGEHAERGERGVQGPPEAGPPWEGQPGKKPPGEGLRLVGLFPVDMGEYIPITITAALPEGRPAPPGTTVDLLPGGTFACATHTGAYDQISLTAHALVAWCVERGHAPTGPIRELYLNDPAVTAPDHLVTQLLIPLEETP